MKHGMKKMMGGGMSKKKMMYGGMMKPKKKKMMYGGMSKKKMMGGGMSKQQMMGGGRAMYGKGGDIAALDKRCRRMATVAQSSLGRPLTDPTA